MKENEREIRVGELAQPVSLSLPRRGGAGTAGEDPVLRTALLPPEHALLRETFEASLPGL